LFFFHLIIVLLDIFSSLIQLVRLYKTVGATVNGDQIPFRTSANAMGQPISEFTGDKRVSNLGWDRDGQVIIQQTQPLPMTILGITGTLVTSD